MAGSGSKVLRVGLLSSIASMDPRDSADSMTSTVLRQVFEPPFEIPSANLPPEPRLFGEKLRRDDAGAAGAGVWSAAIRAGVLFSDDTELTAEIAARSLKRAKVIAGKASIESAGDRVIFRLKEPNPHLDMLLSQINAGVVHETPLRLVGTGPFMFEEGAAIRSLQRATSVRLVRNPNYAGRAFLDEIVFAIYPPDSDGRATRLLDAMKGGEVDFTTSLTSADAAKLDLASFHPSIQPGNSTGFLFFNMQSRAVADRSLRRAIWQLLDRAKIAEKAYERNPLAYVAKSVLPPSMSRDPELIAHNRREAESAFGGGDLRKPDRLRMIIPWAPRPYAPAPRLMAQEIANQLEAVGIQVEIVDSKSSEDFYGRLGRSDYDLALAGWIADTPDPADFFESLFHSSSIIRPGTPGANSLNISRWKSPEMDDALRKFRTEPREQNKDVVLGMVRDEALLVPLVTSQTVAVYSKRVRNFRPSATGAPILGHLDLTD